MKLRIRSNKRRPNNLRRTFIKMNLHVLKSNLTFPGYYTVGYSTYTPWTVVEFLDMGLAGITSVRMATVVLFIYSWNARINLQKYSLDPAAQAHYNQYGSFYRYLTALSFLITILVNVLLIIGDFLPKGILACH